MTAKQKANKIFKKHFKKINLHTRATRDVKIYLAVECSLISLEEKILTANDSKMENISLYVKSINIIKEELLKLR